MLVKQKILIPCLLLSVLLSGCSLESDFAPAADHLDSALEQLNEEMNLLDDKDTLTIKDQQIVITELDKFHESVAEFNNYSRGCTNNSKCNFR
ncbi:hypothetical protein CVD28_18950 [Bacillus sp. M6-12]|uniref:hypothetical protein n=1 Tax=Bacillus sp. M6-12 TaxID=2054166 RepID=UPI000C781130|nr:hypothetical protein [Bacillus sp. M6-12]PLS16120.1 hypothetical protein CVD28_18950 [Bacillus sp. M6-12]